ncbi:MAG: heterodisulfide reductase-related iron-sulfur binding cluster, partial [Alphaproteobacteria bacterium]|nr:heterodisulfide reductase-related iron-sulfur binding cluster [Alphaproteobacteria bacterium]
FKPVIDACTLCDMCFMVTCPYVPPHDFDLDFPHLILRARSADLAQGKLGWADKALAKTDRNGKLARPVAPVANWASDRRNRLTRPVMQAVAGIHQDASLPRYHGKTFTMRAKEAPAVNADAPAAGRKVALFATCFVNYNSPEIGEAARAVLAHNGVETEVAYPGCCGMPQLEQGDYAAVAEKAKKTAAALCEWIDKGYDIVAPVPSCALMLKFEWPLILPDDPAVKRLAAHTADITEYVVDIAGKEGLADGLKPLDGGIAVHLACHARAQNMGPKAVEMLKLIPDADLEIIERCSGHGGAWGVKKEFFEVALKVGKPAARKAARKAAKSGKAHLVSECPLAGEHLRQGIEAMGDGALAEKPARHPIELFAQAYGLTS